jgi:2,4-dienoyl-CoA reductase-like NADH-dependent reductase (Old Yellow Enzyme family)
MTFPRIVRLGGLHSIDQFKQRLAELDLSLPCDDHVVSGSQSPLSAPLIRGSLKIGNRIAVQPMEGWDGTLDGHPTENTFRRWQRFGRSAGKLVWGGEAVAVCEDGRANPNQLLATTKTYDDLVRLRSVLLEEHRRTTGSADDLMIGLQLTHSGRFSRPTAQQGQPRLIYRHPLLDACMKLPDDYPVLSDGDVRSIIEAFHRAAQIASRAGFDFVDIKHCHGYLGHELLSAHTRDGDYGGSFENRTRFLREVVQGVRSLAPGLEIGIRLSVFDTVPFEPDPVPSAAGRAGHGVPVRFDNLLPYRCGFGVNELDPTSIDLTEPIRFLELLENLQIQLVNVTAGSPYYNPHIQRPALFPPSDGYLPPEDPLVGVARQMSVTRELKQRFPSLIFIGSAYTYLQNFLPNVAQAAVREEWVDCVGIGRMLLTYPEMLWDAISGRNIQHKRICRTFSDCTTAPRNGLPSGCYPLDSHYKDSTEGAQLNQIKRTRQEQFSKAKVDGAHRE